MTIKDFIHHYPRALFNDIPMVGAHFYDIPGSGRSLTTYPGQGNIGRLYGVTDERTQMAKIRYLQMKDDTHRLICRTLHEHNSIVMQKLKEDGSKKRMFNHIKRLMRKQEQRDTSIKFLNGSGIIVNDEQEMVKEVERFWGNLFCTNGKVTLGQKKEIMQWLGRTCAMRTSRIVLKIGA